MNQIPSGIFGADKNGAVDASRSEIMYLNCKKNPYIFSIFTRNNKDTKRTKGNEAWVLPRKLSALLWNYYNPGYGWNSQEHLQTQLIQYNPVSYFFKFRYCINEERVLHEKYF